MKFHLWIALKLTLVMVILTMAAYPLLIRGLAYFVGPDHGNGEQLRAEGRVVGFASVGQSFTSDRYFKGRPSAVGYNAAGSGASNDGPSNPALLKAVGDRADSLMASNPGLSLSAIPADMVTASGSGLDPDISPQGALIQVARIARLRGVGAATLTKLVDSCTEGPLLGFLGTRRVNVLELNLRLDRLK